MSQCDRTTCSFRVCPALGMAPGASASALASAGKDSLAMKVTKIIDAFGYVIYGALALLAVWGVYNGSCCIAL